MYDITNGLSYTGRWSADGASYTLQLECPAPPDTPHPAAGNAYAGAAPRPYLVGNSTATHRAYPIRVASLALGVTRVRLKADLRNRARNLRPPMLDPASSDFGNVEPPYITSYTASNYENADASYGAGDLLSIVFNKPTDKAGGERYGLKRYVDDLFSFSEGDPADDYSGEWVDDSTFVVQLLDPIDVVPSVAGRTPFSTRERRLLVGTTGGSGLPGSLIQNRAVSSDRVADAGVRVEAAGDFGEVRSPRLVAFEARDPDNGDEALSAGDELTLTFSCATDRGGATRRFYPLDPRNVVDRAEIDRLIAFSAPLGTDYDGRWRDESTLTIVIRNATVPAEGGRRRWWWWWWCGRWRGGRRGGADVRHRARHARRPHLQRGGQRRRRAGRGGADGRLWQDERRARRAAHHVLCHRGRGQCRHGLRRGRSPVHLL